MSVLRYTALLLTSLLFQGALLAAGAQDLYEVETRPPRGLMPTADQLSSPVDHIDIVNGKLHLEIPLASLPRGRGGSGFDLNLTYDSHLYDVQPEWLLPPWPWNQTHGPEPAYTLQPMTLTGGWKYNFWNLILDVEERADPDGTNCLPQRTYRVRVGTLDGAMHLMHLRGDTGWPYNGDGFFHYAPNGMWKNYCNGWVGQGMLGWLTYYSADGSFLKLEIFADGTWDYWNKPWYLYLPDGSRIVGLGTWGVQEIYDASDNRIRFIKGCDDPPECSQLYTAIVDDSDREIRVYADMFGGQVEDRIVAPGPNGPMTSTVTWQGMVIGNDGRDYGWSVAPWWHTTPLYASHLVVKNIQLPLAPATDPPPIWNSYAFGYNDNNDPEPGYGELDYMRMPSGSEYRYRYEQAGVFVPSTEAIASLNAVVEKTISHDGLTDLRWTYTRNIVAGQYYNKTIVHPDGGQSVHWYNVDAQWPESGRAPLVYRIEEPNGSIRKRIWSMNKVYALPKFEQNPYIEREAVTVGDASGQPSKTAVTNLVYDKNGNLLQKTEYDWVPHIPFGPGYNPSEVEAGVTLRRVTSMIYHAPTSVASLPADDANVYSRPHSAPWQPTGPRRLNAVRRRTVSDGVTVFAATEFDYDDPLTKGNLTAEKRWDSVKSPGLPGLGELSAANAQVLARSYDAYGNLEDIYEPAVRTHITYDAQGNNPTRVDHAYGTAEQRSWGYAWRPNSDALDSKTDLDNNIATSYTYDNGGRVLTVNEANVRRTETTYDDANRIVTVKSDLAAFGDGKLQTATQYDQLGRPVLVRTSEPGNPDGIKAKTTHLSVSGGRRVIRSTPYRGLSDPALEWTCTQLDPLNRVTAVAVFKGSTEPTDCGSSINRTGITQTVFDADQTTIIDPAGKVRRERRDALGRLVEVVEDPYGLNYETHYAYDPLDNLVQVSQGAQTRSFLYSSLSRLLSATNPESGTTSYTYFDTGQLQTRTDARGMVTNFSYDALQRVVAKSYANDGGLTPAVTYSYYLAGAASPNVGQLQSVASSAASTVHDGYDALGRVAASTHTIAGNPNAHAFGYTYWLNNSLKTIQYPSGRIVNNDVDDAGRAIKVYTASMTYADMTAASTPYTPDGRIAKMKLGNDLWETRDYQTPGTPTKFKLGTDQGLSDRLELEYNYSATLNNGNLTSHVIRHSGLSWTQTFGYDGVNRLASAGEAGGFGRIYGYDRYGNRWVASSSGVQYGDTHEPTAQSNFDPATNRLGVAGAQYDAAGNQTFYTPFTLAYDAENRNVSVTSPGNGNLTFAYDGDGRRVRKVWTPSGGSSATTYFIYNALGQLAAEYSTEQPAATGTSWAFTDMLGSVRAVTGEKPSGGTASILECYDYLPFGRLLSAADNERTPSCYHSNPEAQLTSRLPQKFTGKERDETKLDFFGARYYSAAQGRFLSVDPAMESADPPNPQSWNRYAYTFNNPLRYTDPDGRIPVETFVDLASLASSVWGLAKQPSWAAAGYAVWDAASVFLPYVPGSWTRRVADMGYAGLQAAKGSVRFENALEAAAAKRYLNEGVGLLGAGDNQVRSVLGLSRTEKAADFIGVTESGTYVLGEAKGSSIADAVSQLGETAKALLANQGDVRFRAEIVLKKGQVLEGGFRVSGNQLQRQVWSKKRKRWEWEVETVEGQAINVFFID